MCHAIKRVFMCSKNAIIIVRICVYLNCFLQLNHWKPLCLYRYSIFVSHVTSVSILRLWNLYLEGIMCVGGVGRGWVGRLAFLFTHSSLFNCINGGR